MKHFYNCLIGIVLLPFLLIVAATTTQSQALQIFTTQGGVPEMVNEIQGASNRNKILDSLIRVRLEPDFWPTILSPDSLGEITPPTWDIPTNTGTVHGIIVLLEANPRINDIPIQPGDFIGGFYLDDNGQRKCGGLDFWDGTENIIFSLFGNDNGTPEKNGFAFAEVIEFRFFSWTTMKDYIVDVVQFTPESLSKNKWYPLGLSTINNMKSNIAFDCYIQSSSNPLCVGNELTLQAQEFVGTGGPYTYLWSSTPPGFHSTVMNPPPFNIFQTTAYHLIVSDDILTTEHTLTVNVHQLPVANAGSNGIICSNQTFQINGSAEHHSSVYWQSSGNGTFNNPECLTTVYSPGTMDAQNGEVQLILTAFPHSPCEMPAVDSVLLVVSGLPSINLYESLSACTSEPVTLEAEVTSYSSLQWSTSGGGTFSSPNEPVTQYFGSSNDFQYGAIITLSAHPINPCTTVASSYFQLTYLPGPTVNTPNSRIRCENQTVSVNGVASNYSSTEWTTSGDGTFANPFVFSTTYFPGELDKDNGSVSLTLNAYSLTNCPPASKSIAVTLVKLPKVITFGNNAHLICYGNDFMQLDAIIENQNGFVWSTYGDGTFNSTTILNPKYHPGIQDIQNEQFELVLTASPNTPCTISTVETNLVNYQNNPAAQAGTDATIMQGQNFKTLGATASDYSEIIWNTSGTGTFDNNTILATTYTPSETDLSNQPVVLTLTAFPVDPCSLPAIDDLLLTISLTGCINAAANAGEDLNLCAENDEEQVQLSNAYAANYQSLLWSGSGDGYFDFPDQLNPTYIFGTQDLQSQFITLTLFAEGIDDCNSASDNINIHRHQGPVAYAGTEQTACGDAEFQLNGNAENYQQVLWTTNGDGIFTGQATLMPVYHPGNNDIASGSASICLEASGSQFCPTAQDCIELIIVPQPDVFAGGDEVITGGDPFTLSEAMVWNAQEVYWTTSGDGTFDHQDLLNATYYHGTNDYLNQSVNLEITAYPLSPCTLSATDFLQLTIELNCPEIVADAGNDVTICSTNNAIWLNGNAINYESVLWSSSGDGYFSNQEELSTYYHPGTVDISTGCVTLTLTPFGEPPCGEGDSDAITATIIEPATFELISSEYFSCGENEVAFLSNAENFESILWATNGDGTFIANTTTNPVYYPGTLDVASGEVSISVALTSVPPCTVVQFETVSLYITKTPEIEAGNAQTICEGQIVQLSASAENYSYLYWTTSGDGYFSHPQELLTTYIPGTNDIAQGNVSLKITASPIAPCPEVADDEVLISVTKSPAGNAGDDITICAGEVVILSATADHYSAVSWITMGDGTFENGELLASKYFPGLADIQNGLVGLKLQIFPLSPCSSSIEDELFVSIQKQPTANAGTNQTVCFDQTVQLSGQATNYENFEWTTSGDGIFSSSTVLDPVYTPGQEDLDDREFYLILNATGDFCEAAKDSLRVNIQRVPIALAGPDNVVTLGDIFYTTGAQAFFQSSVHWSTPDGSGTFSNPNSIVNYYTPVVADLKPYPITLTLTAYAINPCVVSDSDELLLQVIEDCVDPTVDAGEDFTVCVSTYTTILLNGQAENYSSLWWSTNGDGFFAGEALLDAVYFPGPEDISQGFFELCLAAYAQGDCNNMTDCITIHLQQPPTLFAGEDFVICENDIALVEGDAGNYSEIFWGTYGDGYFEDKTQLSTSYYPGLNDIENGVVELFLTVFGVQPCGEISESVFITIKQQPTANAGEDQTVCYGQTVQLSGEADNYENFEWTTGGDGNFSLSTDLNPVYTPGQEDLETGIFELCLTAIGNELCNNATDCIQVTLQPLPFAFAGNDASVIFGETYFTSQAQVEFANEIMWSSPDGQGSFSNPNNLLAGYLPAEADANAGQVTLELTASAVHPCTVSASSEMTLYILMGCENPTVNAGNDFTVCIEDNTIVAIDFAQADNYSSLQWTTNGNGTFSSATNLITDYYPCPNDLTNGMVELCLTAFAHGICEDQTDCFTISFQPPPMVSAGSDLTICQGQQAQLYGSAQYFETIEWSTTGDGQFDNKNILNPTYNAGSIDLGNGFVEISIKATGLENCADVEDSLILTIATPPTADAGDDITICETETVELSASATNFVSVQWTTTGNGTFSSFNDLITTYFPSTSDVSGTVELCIAAYGDEHCEVAQDCLTVTFQPAPIVEISGDDLICSDGFTMLYGSVNHSEEFEWSTTGTGTFSYQNTLDVFYYPSQQDAQEGSVEICLTASGLHGCADAQACLVVEIQNTPSVYAGEDATIDQGEIYETEPAQADNYTSLLWSANGSGTFNDPTQLHAIYFPSNDDILNGTVTLTLTAYSIEPCSDAVSDDMILTINYSGCFDAVADAGEETAICEDELLQLSGTAQYYAAVQWNTTGDGTFDDATLMNPTYYPGTEDLETGVAELCFTAFAYGNCANATDCLEVIIQPAPIGFAGDDNTIPLVPYTFYQAYAENYSNIQWLNMNGLIAIENDNQLVSTFYPSESEVGQTIQIKMAVSAINPCVISTDAFVNLLITENCEDAIADAGEDILLCYNDQVSSVNLENASASYFKNIQWTTNGDGTFDFANRINPTYIFGANDLLADAITLTLEATGFDTCSSAIDTLQILRFESFEVFAGDDLTLCEIQPIAVNGDAENYVALAWTTSGDGYFEHPDNLSTVYHPGTLDASIGGVTLCLEAEFTGNCPMASDCFDVVFIPVPQVNSGGSGEICFGNSYQLNPLVDSFAYLIWTTGGDGTFDDNTMANATYFPGESDLIAGYAQLIITAYPGYDCAPSYDFFDLNIISLPNANAGPDATIELGQTFDVTGADANKFEYIEWSASGDGTFNDKNIINPTYYPGATDSTELVAILTLTAAPLSPCTTFDSDSMTLTIISVCSDAEAYAGEDATLCSPNVIELNAMAENYSGVLWETSGNGTFENQNTLITFYYPDAADFDAGSVDLCLTAYAFDDCQNATHCVTFTLFENPDADAGEDIFVCFDIENVKVDGVASNYDAVLWTTNGYGFFHQPSQLSTRYFIHDFDPLLDDIYLILTATSDECGSVSDSILLTINPKPIAFAGDDATQCGNQHYIADGFVGNYEDFYWTTDGDGTFSDSTIQNPLYFPGTNDILSGSVELCITAIGLQGCLNKTDCLTLTLSPSAFANAGTDQTICEVENVYLNGQAADYDYLLWETEGDGMFEDKTALTTLYYPGPLDIVNNGAGLQFTAFSSANCGNAVSQIFITINNAPEANAGNDQTICENKAAILNGFAQHQNSAVWTTSGDGVFSDSTSLTASYLPGPDDIQNGTVELCLTALSDGTCPDSVDCLILTIENLPDISAGDDQTLCETETVSLNGTAEIYSSVLWFTSGDGTFDDQGSLTPVYVPETNDLDSGEVQLCITVTPTGACDAVTDCMTAYFIQAPEIFAGEDFTICETAYAIIQGTGSNYDYVEWISNGDGTFSNPYDVSTEYTPGESDRLNGSVELCIVASTDDYCEEVGDCLTLTIQNAPQIELIEDVQICQGDVVILSADVQDFDDLLWTTAGDGTFDGQASATSTYYPGTGDITNTSVELRITANGLHSCDPVSAYVQIQIQPLPTVLAGEDLTICESEIVELDAQAHNYDQLIWTTSGDGTFTQQGLEAGNYLPGPNDIYYGQVELCLTATGKNGCDSTQDCFTVEILLLPEANAGADITLCQGQNATLSGDAVNAVSIFWSTNGDGTFSDPGSLSPIYYPGGQDNSSLMVVLQLTAVGAGNCGTTSDELTLTLQSIPAGNAGDDTTICSGQNVTLAGTASNYSNVFWTTNGDGEFSDAQSLNAIYTPGSNDILAGNVLLCLNVEGLFGCDAAEDCVEIAINQTPLANAGNDFSLCSTGNVQLAGTASNYESVLWATQGDGNFDNVAVLTPVYTPGPIDIQNGAVQLQLTAIGLSPCGVASDNLTISIFDPPQINTSPVVTGCVGDSVQLSAQVINYLELQWQTYGDGTFDNISSASPAYYPGIEDLESQSVSLCISATGLANCEQVSSCLVIDLLENPSVFAGNDGVVLQGSAILLNQATADHYSALLWETSGNGTFSEKESLVTSYYPSNSDVASGWVNITLSASPLSPCTLVVTDTLLLEVIMTGCLDAQVFAGEDQTVCENQSLQLVDATEAFTQSLLWSTDGDGTFDDPALLQPVYTPGNLDLINGLVTLTLKGFAEGNCNDSTHSMEVTIQQNPVYYAGSDNTIPEEFLYTISDAYAENYSMIEWFNINGIGDFIDSKVVNPTFIPSPFDYVIGYVELKMVVSPINPCLIEASSVVIISFEEFCSDVIVEAGENLAICSNETSVQLDGYATGFTTLTWTTSGDGTFNYPNTSDPEYIFGVNDQTADSIILYLHAQAFDTCQSAIDSLVISPLVTPTVFAGENQTLCGNDSATITDAWANDYSTVLWTTGGDGDFSNINQLETAYTPGITDKANGYATLTLTAYSLEPCQVAVESSMVLWLLDGPDIFIDIEDAEALYGTNVIFTVASLEEATYQWYGPNGLMPGKVLQLLILPNVNFHNAGTYYCVLSNECGETYSTEATLTVYQQQVINISQGWTGLSSYIKPHNLSLDHIFDGYENDFLLIKNFNGVYYPSVPITSLLTWNPNAGYEAHFINSVQFVMKGIINPNRTVELNQGWNYLPVISSCEVDIEDLFDENIGYVELIKDIAGMCIYWPQHGINTIGTLKPGKAYFIRVSQPVTITYDECQQSKSGTIDYSEKPENITIWNDIVYSPSSHLIALDLPLAETLMPGDIIGAFTTSGVLAGFAQYSAGINAITLFGDMPLTPEVEGFSQGEPIRFMVFRPSSNEVIQLEVEFDHSYPQHDGTYYEHGISGIKLKSDNTAEAFHGNSSGVTLFPNPTQGQINLMGVSASSIIELWSADGRKLMRMNGDGMRDITDTTIRFDISEYRPGIYFIRIVSGANAETHRVVLR